MKKVKIPHMIMKIFWLVSLAKGAEITWAEPSSISKWYYRKASSLVLYIGTDTISITISPPRLPESPPPPHQTGPRALRISTPRHGVPAVWTARHQVAA
jgi:hypothetical protein